MSEKKKLGLLWGIAVCVSIVAVVMSWVNSRGSNEELFKDIGRDLSEAVNGDYKDYRFEYSSIDYIYMSKKEKQLIVEVLKSIADNTVYEVADTVYKTQIEFNTGSIVMELKAKYLGLNVHEELGLLEIKELESNKYWDSVEKFVRENFKYKQTGKVDIQEILASKAGQCYSFSELGYLLGKEKGESVRMVATSNHAWNRVENESGVREVDLTSGLEEVE